MPVDPRDLNKALRQGNGALHLAASGPQQVQAYVAQGYRAQAGVVPGVGHVLKLDLPGLPPIVIPIQLAVLMGSEMAYKASMTMARATGAIDEREPKLVVPPGARDPQPAGLPGGTQPADPGIPADPQGDAPDAGAGPAADPANG